MVHNAMTTVHDLLTTSIHTVHKSHKGIMYSMVTNGTELCQNSALLGNKLYITRFKMVYILVTNYIQPTDIAFSLKKGI